MKILRRLLSCLLLPLSLAYAQPNDRIDPKSPELKELPEVGRMVGTAPHSSHYGQQVAALGDINNDSLADWCVSAFHTGTGLPQAPVDLLVYKGITGGLPSVESGQRIGPTEVASNTRFVAAGDWDADGHVDIATEIALRGDTSGGNTHGYEVSRVVVWWGNSNGTYSLADTTHLSSGTEVWGGVRLAVGTYQLGDGVDNLLMWTWGQGLTNGEIINHPQMLLYPGHRGQRWGRNGIARTSDWGWWTPPKIKHLYTIDQNCDNAPDLVIAFDDDGVYTPGQLSILYGTPTGGFPDTTSVVTLDLKVVNGHNALLSDITGDGVPELLVVSMDEIIHIYGGEPGVRLLEQFGSGNDPSDPQHGRKYPRPWAELPLPRKLDNAFSLSGLSPLFNLGDAGLNGTNDIWVYSYPFIIAYTTGHNGECLDSLFDGIIYPAGESPLVAVVLGDIDGSGVPTIALGFDIADIVQFVKPTKQVREDYCAFREPLHGDGIRCGSLSGVEGARVREGEGETLKMQATPNPANNNIQLQWNGDHLSGNATITISDPLGREVQRLNLAAASNHAVWWAAEATGSVYFITLTIGESSATVKVVITR